MPRITRSTRRGNIAVLAESDTAAAAAAAGSTSSPTSPTKARAPLATIHGNNADEAVAEQQQEESQPAIEVKKKTAGAAKKGKAAAAGKKKAPAKKGRQTKQPVEAEEEEQVVGGRGATVAEGENKLESSEAALQASAQLATEPDHEGPPSAISEAPSTPPSKAVRATRKQMAGKSTRSKSKKRQPEKIEIETFPEPVMEESRSEEDHEQLEIKMMVSPAHTAVSTEPFPEYNESPERSPRSPAPGQLSNSMTLLGSPSKSQIKLKGKGKTAKVIEDSVQAIDELEEALERIGQQMPEIALPESPSKANFDTKDEEKPETREVEKDTTGKTQRKVPVVKSAPAVKPPVKPSPAKPATIKQRRASPTKVKLQVVQEPSQSSSSSSLSDTGKPASTRRSIQLSFPPPPPPAKSTKPPTRPTFELPGEAVARKLKEKREERERLRLEAEEAEKKKQENRRKPSRTGPAPTVKPTAASRARESLKHKQAAAVNLNSKSESLAAPVDHTSRRSSSLTVPKRPSVTSTANTSIRRMPSNASIPGATVTTASRSTSTSTNPGTGAVKSVVTSTDMTQQRQRGREVFNRDKIESEERERIRREKEESARRARAEAAERGRQASKEWADRQRAKMLAAKKKAAGDDAARAGSGAVTSV